MRLLISMLDYCIESQEAERSHEDMLSVVNI